MLKLFIYVCVYIHLESTNLSVMKHLNYNYKKVYVNKNIDLK